MLSLENRANPVEDRVSLASHLIYERWPDVEEYSTWLSLAAVSFVSYAMAAVRFSKLRSSARDAPAAVGSRAG